MKLLFQSDDYGISEGVACGILKGIRDGLIRNTGLFVNMPSTAFAVEQIQQYPQCCLGIDINLVSGFPVTPAEQIPNLVKPTGEFYTSGELREKSNLSASETFFRQVDNDPFPFEETLLEAENQVKRFIELTGKKPGYIHGHSMMTPNVEKVLETVAEKYQAPYSMGIHKKFGFHWLTNNWNPKPFPIKQQIQTDVEGNVLKVIPEILNYEYAAIICHAGFVDEDLFHYSTYTLIRAKDLYMVCSPRLKDFIKSHDIQLITYNDLAEA